MVLADLVGGKNCTVGEGGATFALRWLSDSSALTIENYQSHGAETFQLADGTWVYDKQTGGWAQTKAR